MRERERERERERQKRRCVQLDNDSDLSLKIKDYYNSPIHRRGVWVGPTALDFGASLFIFFLNIPRVLYFSTPRQGKKI